MTQIVVNGEITQMVKRRIAKSQILGLNPAVSNFYVAILAILQNTIIDKVYKILTKKGLTKSSRGGLECNGVKLALS